jgi:DNA-binding transcriptional LysR family regulator
LLDFPLVHQRDRRGWQQWFGAAGIDAPEARFGTVIDDTNLVLQTALNGQGVVLGILPFVEEDISEGRLLRPFDLAVDPGQAYYLIYAKQRLEKPAVRAVRDWLLSQIS